jgi:uncharacterized protein YndB with AHSA1/START domain
VAVSHNALPINASPEAVFDVLTDPTTYPEWLVGAQRIDHVQDDWPAPGSKFFHRIGAGPAVVLGSTTVRSLEAPHRLDLAAGMGPLGEAAVWFRIEPTDDGCIVSIEEVPRRGLARAAWRIGTPLVIASLWGRNALSLQSLAELVESRAGGRRG